MMISSIFRRQLTRPLSSFLTHQAYSSLPKRRRRKKEGFDFENERPQKVNNGPIQLEGFRPAEDNFDDYLKKASLSPWVPVPDVVARKMLELAKAGPNDVGIPSH